MTDPIAKSIERAGADGFGSERVPAPLPSSLIYEIAMDVGKEIVAYIERMYPNAITATSSTFRLSIRNHIANDILGAVKMTDERDIREWLDRRRANRRQSRAIWKTIRGMDWDKRRAAKDV